MEKGKSQRIGTFEVTQTRVVATVEVGKGEYRSLAHAALDAIATDLCDGGGILGGTYAFPFEDSTVKVEVSPDERP